MTSDTRLVSVIVPAYNAATTIDETLRSIRSQSHRSLDIVVVDDGSTDDTVRVAQRHARDDSRVRILEQRNAGVAAARNCGWQNARSDLISFIDADDLWAPDKTSRQLQALLSAGDKTGLVYSWHIMIDAESRILAPGVPSFCSGQVLKDIFQGNFIGNGSAVLVRREALIAAGGFDEQLRRSNAQGCEDLLFYCRVAETFEFSVVPDYLIGYRQLPNNMSSDLPRMLRSWMLVVDEMAGRYPDRIPELKAGLRNYSSWLLRRAVKLGDLQHFSASLSLLVRRDPALALRIIVHNLPVDTLVAARRVLRERRRNIALPESRFSIGRLGQSDGR